jgi:tetratricopeptide (TPR) repeat protein
MRLQKVRNMPGTEGRTLREWRRARGWDVPQLARQLRHASTEPVAAHDGLVRMIRSWERGTHALSERYELLYRSLGFEGLAAVPAVPSAVSPAGPETIAVCCKTPDGRITFVDVPVRRLTGADSPVALAAAGTLSSPLSRAPARPRPRQDPDARPAERFLLARQALRDNDNLFGPHEVLPLAVRQLAIMRDLSRSLPGGGRRELLRPQVQFADLLGWLYQDCREFTTAAHWLDRALEWAHMMDDQACVAFILARKSQLACDMGEPGAAIAAAEAALRITSADLIGAAAATYAAHGHALAGDAAASGRLYERARTVLAGADGADPTPWVTFLDNAYIDVYEAGSLAVLGEHDAAASGFAAAIAGLRPAFHRDRGVYLAREARSRAGAGEHEHAAELALEALAIGAETQSARIFAELDDVRDATAPAASTAAVTSFQVALSAAAMRLAQSG